ncbi:non-specific lipid-transfer protein 1-like [Salvia miltiorrhiza]|uniref:non-specific lipid-transfer protein 1-like n=1 Tax=Salvia miltiorrhiza TaxID=226208 RepID=UPI0025ABA708|nr:non-specific lipid-transfer protein 1-like [Salvia miltiorrhiza]
MAGFGEVKVMCLVVIAVAAAAAAPHAEGAISCGQVLSSVSPCLSYLQGRGAVTPPCCDGLKSLNKAAATTADRQALCGCIKSLAPGVGAKAEFINSLPSKCGVALPYRYSPSVDCSKVK